MPSSKACISTRILHRFAINHEFGRSSCPPECSPLRWSRSLFAFATRLTTVRRLVARWRCRRWSPPVGSRRRRHRRCDRSCVCRSSCSRTRRQPSTRRKRCARNSADYEPSPTSSTVQVFFNLPVIFFRISSQKNWCNFCLTVATIFIEIFMHCFQIQPDTGRLCLQREACFG